MSKIKEGDVVMLALDYGKNKKSISYASTSDYCNSPSLGVGVVVEDNRPYVEGLDIAVEWEDGGAEKGRFWNSYNKLDLFKIGKL